MGRWSGGGGASSEEVEDLVRLIEDAARKRRECIRCVGDGFVETWKYDPDIKKDYPLMRICDCRKRHEGLIRRLRGKTHEWQDHLTGDAVDTRKTERVKHGQAAEAVPDAVPEG